VIGVMVGGFLPVDAVVAGALGVSVGSSILLIFGEPAHRPIAAQVVAALQECGVDVATLKQWLPAAEGPDMFGATTREGTTHLTVRVYAADDRDRDRLARLTRWLLVRDPEEDRDGFTVESAAEDEMLAMVAAAQAGGRVPAYPIAGGQGPPGALVAWIDVGGRRLDFVPAAEVTDATLADLWKSVGLLQEHRVAHRRLRPDNITVDSSGRAWLTGLVLADLGANERHLATDVAKLLTSLAVQIGVDRTVASAVAGPGPSTVAAAAAHVQPPAVSGPTRAAVRDHDRERSVALSDHMGRRRLRPGGRPSLYADLRSSVAQVTGEPAVEPDQLGRFTRKKALSLMGAFAVIYLILPQLANAGAAFRALQHAHWWWVLAAVPALFIAQAFSTLLQLGAIPADRPADHQLPVGHPAAHDRLFRQNRTQRLCALAFPSPPVGASSDHRGTGRVRPVGPDAARPAFFARQDLDVHPLCWHRDRPGGQKPAPLALTAIGALGGPMVQIVALWLCVHALGGHLPFVQIGAVYLGGHLVASAAPVPGGLGALEAALVARLSALGMPVGAAASTVLIYRLLTYWLTIPVGWLSLKVAEERGYV
jgi:hypothetical protein